MCRKLFCLTVVCIFVCFEPFAQVNLQTGSATFSFPMLNWQDNKSRLNLGVTLSYNSGNGVKVNEVASNVGQGWNLIAGGVISRMQVGEPDDQMPYGSSAETDINKYPAGYLYASVPAANGCPLALTSYPIYKSRNQVYKQHNVIAEDKQLDYFSFQFNGKTGLFILDKVNGDKGVTLGDSKLKITFLRKPSMATNNSSGIRTAISSFTIQDVDGLLYKFADLGLAKVLSSNYCDKNLIQSQTQPKFDDGGVYHQTGFDNVTINPWVVNSWYLTEIEDPLTHRKIRFNYVTRDVNAWAGDDIAYNEGDKKYCIITHKKSITKTPEIYSIIYPDGHAVAFNYSPTQRVDLAGQYPLSSVDVTYAGRYLSKYKLNTTYFILNRYGTPSSPYQKRVARLCLKSVQKIGVDLKEETLPYLFDYYVGSNTLGDFVPPPFFYAKDIWGYNNGSNSVGWFSGESIPLDATMSQLSYSQLKGLCFLRRNGGSTTFNYFVAKPGYAKNGLLRQIIYPTGGTLTYQYDQNTGIVSGNTQSTGGVHVSQTSSTDGNSSNGCNNPLTTSYNYVLSNGASSLWGLEMPQSSMTFYNHYQPQSRYYTWSLSCAPFGCCKWRYQYPGIPSQQQSVDLPQWINLLNNVAPALGVLSTISFIKDMVTVFTGGSPVALIVDIVLNLVQIALTCFGDQAKDKTVGVYYNADLNSGNPLPTQFKRVEIVENPGTRGKTVQTFTSDDDYSVWVSSNPDYSPKQRYASWAYGLPKLITQLDANGNKVKETENIYDFSLAQSYVDWCTLGHGIPCSPTGLPTLLVSCQCTVIKSSSLRNDDWSNPSLYNSPSSYITSSNADLKVGFYGYYTGRVPLVTTKERTYKTNDLAQFLEAATNFTYNGNYDVSSIFKTESDGNTHYKYIKYNSEFSGGALDVMNQNNILSVPVEITNYRTNPTSGGAYLHSDVTEFLVLSNGDIKPYRTLQERTDKPVTWGIGDPWVYYNGPSGTNYSKYKVTQVFTYDAFGNLVGQSDEGNRTASSIYGYNDKFVIASAINAKSNEIFFDPFEEETGWNGTTAFPYGDKPLSDFDKTMSYTGRASGRIDKPTAGERYCHSNKTLTVSLTAPTKYKVSGWVYSNGPSVDIYLFMNRANETTYFSYVDYMTTSVTNQWVYLEKDFTVPADVTKLNIRLDNNGGGTVWFDDIRLYPSNGRMMSYTYDPLIGKTSETDENNLTTYYEYDNLGRLRFIKDDKKNIVKMYEYNSISPAKQAGCPGIYYNRMISETFTRNTCGSGYIGGDVPYTVSANAFSSTISQADADAKAESFLMTYGQDNANTYGACIQLYYNTIQSQSFETQSCSPGYTGGTVTYTVPANKYYSTVNVQDANQMALDEIEANGQAYANDPLHAVCNINYTPVWEAVDGAPTRCQTVNGQLPPHLFMLATNVNPNSSTFGITEWKDLGPDNACPAGNYYNNDYSGYYYSQNCPYNQTPIGYYVNVPPGMFSSTISQTNANNQAAQYAQNQANLYGTCQSANVTLTYWNDTNRQWIVELLDPNTYDVLYQFYVNKYYSSEVLGDVPAGTYNILIYQQGWDSNWYWFEAGCGYYASGSQANFYSVNIDGMCSSISINY